MIKPKNTTYSFEMVIERDTFCQHAIMTTGVTGVYADTDNPYRARVEWDGRKVTAGKLLRHLELSIGTVVCTVDL